jgi:glutathione S-transferase
MTVFSSHSVGGILVPAKTSGYRASGLQETMMTDVVLYADSKLTSPYALSVFVTLVEKQIPFELEVVDLGARENEESAYRALSKTSRVPTIRHGEFSLSESTAITEYLETTFASPHHISVYPQDVRDLARARQVQAWLRSDLLSLREERSTDVIFVQPTNEPLSQRGKVAADKLITIAEALLPIGQNQMFSDWCIADTDLALMLNRLVANGDPVPPRLRQFVDVQWNRPSVQRWVKMPRG